MTTILKSWRTVYKLTDALGQTHGGTQWGPGITNPCGVLSGEGSLCSGVFYHAYHAAELAVFLNPIGANFDAATMRLWRAEIRGTVHDEYGILKLGASQLRTIAEIDGPRPTIIQRTAFGILVALATVEASDVVSPGFVEWANDWLDNVDRTASAAASAESAASAAWSAARSARSATWSAAPILLDAAVLALAESWED